jgi:hypothetical protein
VDADLDTLATALYVTIDDALQHAPELRPWRPAVGIAPKLTAHWLCDCSTLLRPDTDRDHRARGAPGSRAHWFPASGQQQDARDGAERHGGES